MAKKKNKEFKDQSVQELQAHLLDVSREIFELRNELALQRRLGKPHLIKEKRRNRARLLTILTQKLGNKKRQEAAV